MSAEKPPIWRATYHRGDVIVARLAVDGSIVERVTTRYGTKAAAVNAARAMNRVEREGRAK